MQLEKIRSADTQVRWQDEEDCYKCPSCKQDFTVTRRKVSKRLSQILKLFKLFLFSLIVVIAELFSVKLAVVVS